MKDEILEVAAKIYKAGMSLLVIDTENKFVSTGFAKEIARVAQGLCAAILLNKCI
jgi:magnesium chelatase subunit D